MNAGVRGVFGHQRPDIRHRGAQPEASHKAKEHHLFYVVPEGGGDGPETEEENAVDDDFLTSQPVGEGAGENRPPQREADQRR